MKISILTYGSQGDVAPFLSLAQGFFRAGHTVRFAGPEHFKSLLKNPEIEFFGFPGDPQQLVQDLVDGAGSSRLGMVRVMGKFVVPLAVRVLEQARAACEDSDVIIHSFLLTSVGYELAREMGAADISCQLFPVFSRTVEFQAPTFPDLPFGDPYRQLTHDAVTQIFWQGSRFLYKRVRRSNPQLSPLTSWPFDAGNDWQTPIFYGFSPSVIPRPRDWRDDVHITGYWFSDDLGGWSPGKDLLDFLDGGPAPIAIVFGSTNTKKWGRIIKNIVEALTTCKQRGVIVGAEGQSLESSPDVFLTDYVPYSWLFQRSSAVIHHGGAGTTGAGLRAGIPNMILPFTSDQPFWGNRVYSLGAGPKPIPAKNITAEKLSKAISLALNDEGMRVQARSLGETISAEDGISRAVELTQKYVDMKAIKPN